MNATASSMAAVAEKFRSAFLLEETGTLEVRSGRTAYSILFDRGMVGGASEGAQPDDSGPAPGTSEDTARIVELAFSCRAEHLEFVPGNVSADDPQADILRTVELFITGIRAMRGFEEIREALQSMDQRLVLRSNPTVPLERLTLTPIHGFVLSRLAASMSFRDIMATVGPDEEDEAARFIYALLLLGSAALDPPFAHGLLRTDLLLMDHRRDFAREESEIAFIRETYSSVQAQNPYQILGIQETAPAEEIRKSYDERKRALAPERFLERVRDQMRSELAIIEARLAEVYLALQSGGSDRGRAVSNERETLDLETLSLRREFTKTEVAASLDEQERLGESYYQKAKQYFNHGDYYNCIQYCTQAIRQTDQVARYYFLMGEAQAHNPDRRWQKMAEQSFLQGIKLDPWNANYLVTLGQFYRRQGFGVRARRQFEKALQIQPSHPKAKEELDSLR